MLSSVHCCRYVKPSLQRGPTFGSVHKGTNLGNSASVHGDYWVIIGDCVELMGHLDHCSVPEFFLDYVFDKEICLHVYVGGGFIEDEDSATKEECSREA